MSNIHHGSKYRDPQLAQTEFALQVTTLKMICTKEKGSQFQRHNSYKAGHQPQD